MPKGRIYAVDDTNGHDLDQAGAKNGFRLIRASSPAHAERRAIEREVKALRARFSARLASQDDLMHAFKAGVPVEELDASESGQPEEQGELSPL